MTSEVTKEQKVQLKCAHIWAQCGVSALWAHSMWYGASGNIHSFRQTRYDSALIIFHIHAVVCEMEQISRLDWAQFLAALPVCMALLQLSNKWRQGRVSWCAGSSYCFRMTVWTKVH